MNINFKNKNVLITGGSRGIGSELVKTFSELEADVTYTSTKELDFNNEKSVSRFLDTIKDKPFDICINICDIKDTDWNNIINVNLTGCYKICKCVSKLMIEQTSGRL